MTLTQLDKSPEATGELESPWCAGENPGVFPRDFDQRVTCGNHGMARDAHAANAAHDAIDASSSGHWPAPRTHERIHAGWSRPGGNSADQMFWSVAARTARTRPGR